MGRKRHTPEQIITALREAEVGLARGKSVKLISRELGITEQVRYQYETVATPVPAHLIRFGGHAGVVLHTLHLDDASLRDLSLPRAALLDLLRRVEGIVRMAGTLIRPLENAEHLGLQLPERPGETSIAVGQSAFYLGQFYRSTGNLAWQPGPGYYLRSLWIPIVPREIP